MLLPDDTVPSNGTDSVDELKPADTEKETSRPLSWAERVSRAPSGGAVPSTKHVQESTPHARIPRTCLGASPTAKPEPPPVPAFALATKDKPVVVLDAGALMRVEALDRYRQKCTFVTTAEAAQEVRDALARRRIGERFLDIQTVQPTAADLGWVEKFAGMTGDLPFLSGTDLGIISLTYMLQRATGQTERLKLRPPAFEFFNEAELQSTLESSGDSKHLWTLQRVNAAQSSSKPTDSEKADNDEQPCGNKASGEAEAASDSAESEDMDAEEGWVTEDVLRGHLGLVAPGEVHDSGGASEPNAHAASGDTEELSNAFSGLELRADFQEVEDLVSCMTTDFSMQNVLLQMGLAVLAVDGKKIRTVKMWALLCRACGHTERKTRLLFCSKCGHHTLDRTPLYFDQVSGKIYVFDGRKRFSKRGQVYSIPKDSGGKHSRPVILAADQLLMGGLDRELRHKEKLWKKDVESKYPLSPDYCLEAQSWHLRAFTASGRAAAAARPKVVFGLGPGNPNSNRWRKHCTRQRK